MYSLFKAYFRCSWLKFIRLFKAKPKLELPYDLPPCIVRKIKQLKMYLHDELNIGRARQVQQQLKDAGYSAPVSPKECDLFLCGYK